MICHNWIVPVSLMVSLGTVAKNAEDLMYIAYFSLFGLFCLIGSSRFFQRQKLRNNGYKILGSLSTVVLLLILSFDWFWSDLRTREFSFNELLSSPEFFASAAISLTGFIILFLQTRNKTIREIEPIALVSVLFIITFMLGLFSSAAVVLINLCLFALGITTILQGAKLDHLGVLNYGLLIIMALVICRFFDSDLSFVIRGVLFVSAGIGFFATNYWMLKKRKANE